MADIDDLKAAFEQLVQAFNASDIDSLSECLHSDVMRFSLFIPFAEDGRAVMVNNLQASFAHQESRNWSQINPQYRVIGTTGIVWSNDRLSVKPKDGPMTSVYARTTITFAKVDGKWLALALHHSELPSGR